MIKTPFFPRQMALCESMRWTLWSGHYAVNSYLQRHDAEYFAFRTAAGLLDVTPLFKYMVTGPDAAAFLAQIMVKDIARLSIGRVTYLCWCDHNGKVVGDGTVMRRGETEYFVTTTDPCYGWFSRFLGDHHVHLEDAAASVAALALQGPCARQILQRICDADMDRLRFFATTSAIAGGVPVWISRTGYTGDLGYEIWVEAAHALPLWDALMTAGADFALRPAGLKALDVCRVEAGLILKHVDYHSALHALVESRKSSPYELALGWTVDLDRAPFTGQAALQAEKRRGSPWSLVGLDIDWTETEKLYARCGLPPNLGSEAWRASVPLYHDVNRRRQIGYATSGTWSPVLKKNIALASIRTGYATHGTRVQIEMTVEHERHSVTATVRSPRFFNPERRMSSPTRS